MESATRSGTRTVNAGVAGLEAPFVAAFEGASERWVRALYDHVADDLSASFDAMSTASAEQIAVLNRVAKLVGLDGVDVGAPLANPDSEALAQRISWRSASRWAVLSLLWTLVEARPNALTTEDWAQTALAGDGKRPRGRSSLPSQDEPMAIELAAKTLATAPALTNGSGSFVLGIPVVIQASHADTVVANQVRPTALVEAGDPTTDDGSIALAAGDRVSLASDGVGISPEGEYRRGDHGTFTMTGAGQLRLDSQTHKVGVVPGCTLLFEGESLEGR